MKVQLFIPCFMDQLFPNTSQNVWNILETYGCEVIYPLQQTCCGQAPYNAGYELEATRIGNRLLKNFNIDIPVVCPSASCTGYIKEHLIKNLIHSTSPYKEIQFFELTNFLVHKLKIIITNISFPYKVAYHTSCASLRECITWKDGMTLLNQVKGLELLMLKDNTTCCGFGGTFSVKFPDISASMGEEKIFHAIATGAEYITSLDMSCLMHLQGLIDKKSLPIKTIHITDILTANLSN
ncbi:MAG: (Fe-S)-binding protein [Chitinophagaceae bacterium]